MNHCLGDTLATIQSLGLLWDCDEINIPIIPLWTYLDPIDCYKMKRHDTDRWFCMCILIYSISHAYTYCTVYVAWDRFALGSQTIYWNRSVPAMWPRKQNRFSHPWRGYQGWAFAFCSHLFWFEKKIKCVHVVRTSLHYFHLPTKKKVDTKWCENS